MERYMILLKPGGEELIGSSLPGCQILAETWLLELEA